MTEDKHKEIENKLKTEYVGKFIWDKDNGDFDKIADVYVDYREDAQHMNRVVTEYGNVYFISELKKEAFIV